MIESPLEYRVDVAAGAAPYLGAWEVEVAAEAPEAVGAEAGVEQAFLPNLDAGACAALGIGAALFQNGSWTSIGAMRPTPRSNSSTRRLSRASTQRETLTSPYDILYRNGVAHLEV